MQSNTIIPDKEPIDLNPAYFGYETCLPSKAFGVVRGGYLIHCVVSGCGIFKIHNKEYQVNAGKLFVIPPGEDNYYIADDNNPWTYIWIGFDTNTSLYFDDVIHCPEAIGIFQAMKKCTEYKNGRTAYLKARLWDLFALLLDNEVYTMKYIDDVLKYMHAEYMHEISIAGIARHLNLNRTYLSALFKEKMGISPKQYLTKYRMNIAASLLGIYGKSASVTAKSVGYPDLFAFSKTFKRYFGMPPSKYAQTVKKQFAQPRMEYFLEEVR